MSGISRTPGRFLSTLNLAKLNVATFFKSLAAKPRYQHPLFPDWFTVDKAIIAVAIILTVFLLVDPFARQFMRALPLLSISVFQIITDLSRSHWYITPAALCLIIFMFFDWSALSRRMRVHAEILMWRISGVLLSVALSGIAVNLLKRAIGRARPSHFDDLTSFGFDPFAFTSSFASFPSGHATTAGSVAVLALIYFPKYRALILTLALIAALSRVVVWAHYPADILAGLLFGALFTCATLPYLANRGLGYVTSRSNASQWIPILPRPIWFPVKSDRFVHESLSALTTNWRNELPNDANGSKKPEKAPAE